MNPVNQSETSSSNIAENITEFESKDNAQIKLSAHAEFIELEKQRVVTARHQIQIQTKREQQQLQLALEQRNVKVEVIAVGEYVDAIPQIEKNGSVTTIPVFEERLEVVTVKRIYLKEMITISEQSTERIYEQQIELRKQQVHVSFHQVDNHK